MYKVEEKDLIGYLEGFPIEVAQKLIEYQVLQSGKSDITIFQENKKWNLSTGGFDWTATDVKEDRLGKINFWSSVLNHKNWGTFFNRFPKIPKTWDEIMRTNAENPNNLPDVIFGDSEEEAVKLDCFEKPFEENENPFASEPSNIDLPNMGDPIFVGYDENHINTKRIFIAYVSGQEYPILTVTNNKWNEYVSGKTRDITLCIYKYYKKIENKKVTEMTLEEVNKRLGLNIKIVNK